METSDTTTRTAAEPPSPVHIDQRFLAGSEPSETAPDMVMVPARQGLEAVDILRRTAHRTAGCGPVLHDGACDTLGFLVPPGTADAWDLPGSACTQTAGRGLRFDFDAQEHSPVGTTRANPDRAVSPPLTGAGWLLPPETTDPLTDPAVLRAALGEAARIIEAADSCR